MMRFVESVRNSLARLEGRRRLDTAREAAGPNKGLAVLGMTLAVAMSACGGGSPAGPTPTPTPRVPVTTLVTQGTGSIGRFEILKAIPFTTSGSGRIDITVDWTFTTSLMQIAAYRGNCTAAELNALNCGSPIAVNNPPKPIRISLNDAAAGAYTIGILNLSFTDESFSYQVTLTR